MESFRHVLSWNISNNTGYIDNRIVIQSGHDWFLPNLCQFICICHIIWRHVVYILKSLLNNHSRKDENSWGISVQSNHKIIWQFFFVNANVPFNAFTRHPVGISYLGTLRGDIDFRSSLITWEWPIAEKFPYGKLVPTSLLYLPNYHVIRDFFKASVCHK
jgi:hypothetical protein